MYLISCSISTMDDSSYERKYATERIQLPKEWPKIYRETREPRSCQNILIPQSNFLRSTYSWTFLKFASSFQLDCNANFYHCRSKLNSVSYLQKKLSSADPVWSKGEQNKLAFSRFGSTTSLSVRSVSVNNQPL